MTRVLAGCALAAALASTGDAHVVLSQTSFTPGVNFAAFFKVGHGCGESPTTSLTVEIPEGVDVITFPAKPGWKLELQRARGAAPMSWNGGNPTGPVHSVTWRGKLDVKANDQFGLMLKLPSRQGAIYFPTVQTCQTGENRWVEIPAPGQAWNSVPHPAPVLTLIAAADTAVTAGALRVEQSWTRATAPNARTAAGYFKLTNSGTVADTLTGGSTDAAEHVEIHSVTNVNGVSSMRVAPGGISIAPGATVDMAPAGPFHLMLVGLKAPLVAGQKIPLTLNFTRAGAVRVELSVAAIGALAPAEANEHAHHH